jgi:phage I-like protein
MVQRLAYAVDLNTVKFEDATGTWIHAMPLGEYDHPVYGKVSITPDRVQTFATNVNGRVREIDPDVDYDHKATTKEAAGWVKKAEARSDGLWLFVDWTTQAAQKIKDKAYRYFSPEFADEWEHPKSKTKFKDVLFGGALTNRPFFKDLLPLNMSELFEEQQNRKESGMDPKELRAKLGLAEDATDEQVQAKLDELTAPKNDDGKTSKPEDDKKNEPGGDPASLAASEAAKALAKQFSDNPEVAKLFSTMQTALEENSKTIAGLRTENFLNRIDSRISKMSEGGKYKIPPSVLDMLKTTAMKMSDDDAGKMFDAFEQLTKVGMVETGERGRMRTDNQGDDKNAVQQFGELVDKLVEKDKITEGEAMERVARENPQLYEEYRRASTYGGDNAAYFVERG